jgi:hypothetical protein
MGLQLEIKKGAATGNGVAYDSRLELGARGPSTNADFFLTLRIWFERVSGMDHIKDANGKYHEIMDWDEKDPENPTQVSFADWKTKACQRAAAAWDQKLWLRTPDDYAAIDWPEPGPRANARPNLHCRLECSAATAVGQAHAIVKAVRLRPVASMGYTDNFRSDSGLWDLRDAEEQGPQKRLTAAHEVGHLLGLPHVGAFSPDCIAAGNSNADPCYLDGASPDNIMGKGMTITGINAWPWVSRIAEHTQGATKPADWRAWNARWVPRVVNGGKVQ